MTEVLIQALIVYILAILVAESYALQWFRDLVNDFLFKIKLAKITDQGTYELITCRLCLGFWFSIAVGFLLGNCWVTIGAGYGLATFLESIERD